MPDTLVFLRRSLFTINVLEQHKKWLTHEEAQTLNDELSIAQMTRLLSRWSVRLIVDKYASGHTHDLSIETTSTGKPFFKNSDIMFNITHSGDWIILAITQRENIGIDYEHMKKNSNSLKIAARFFSVSENQELTTTGSTQQGLVFNQMWSAKEAILKAVGLGIAHMLKQVTVSPAAHTFHFDHDPTRHYTLSGFFWDHGWLHVFSHKSLQNFDFIELTPTLEIHPITSTLSIVYNRSTHL